MYLYEGSGGGSIATSGNGGYGGGIIYVEGFNVTINGGKLNSAGGEGADQSDSGGGAGGTVFVSAYHIRGNGTVDVTGGSSQGRGGAGSGGRVLFMRLNWTDPKYFVEQGKYEWLKVKIDAGDSNLKDGRNGSVWSTPCP